MALPSVVPVQDNILTALRTFLITVLPSSVEVVEGQVNRVPEPASPDFVTMTPIRQNRLETNIDLYADCAFNASIAGNVLSISQMIQGTIQVGNSLFGIGVPTGTFIAGSAGGTGGIGNYTLSGTLGTIPTEIMASGVFFAMQPVEDTIQLDVHGPNSADNARIISTLFRDNFAVALFKDMDLPPPPGWQDIPVGGTISVPYNTVRPLYADDPHQAPFVNAEGQYENRWVIDACLQANAIVTAPQMFAAAVKVTLINA